MLTYYEEHLRLLRRSPYTIRLRLTYMRAFARTHDLATATVDDLARFRDSNPAWSTGTQHVIVVTFHSFFGWARRAGYIDEDPSAELRDVRVSRRPGRITPESVIHMALSRADRVEEAMLRLGAECGLRANEIATLHTDDRRGEWLIVNGKGGKIRKLCTTPELAAVLDTLEAEQGRGYYFPGSLNAHIGPGTVWKHVTRLTEMNPHALRHRFGTQVYKGTGHDLRATQEALGHASPATTAIYVHVVDEDLERVSAAARLSGALASLPTAA